MNGQPKFLFEFGEYRLIPAERLLLKDGSPIQLPPKAFDILVVLVENAGQLVDNKTMLETVWPDSFVEEANIQVQMSSIRKALGENGKRLYIETVPKIGYRFVSKVEITQNGHHSEGQLAKDEGNLGVNEKPATGDRRLFSIVSRRPILSISCVLAAILLVGTGFLASGFLRQRIAGTNFSNISQRMKPVKLTDSGSAFGAAISQDGKYVAYETINAGKYSTWLMDLATKSSVQITPQSDTVFNGITFSPDGDFIYYNAVDSQPVRTVYRMPKFGGEAKKILVGISSPIGFSPDGKRFAFVREFPKAKETVLMTANADGTGEQPLAKRTLPDKFATGLRPAWSPDNKTIACIGRNFDEEGGFHVLTCVSPTGQYKI